MRRRAGESILIGEDIEIQIINIGESRVKIGIIAPKSVPVSMKEVRLVGQENLAAAQLQSVVALRRMLDRLIEGPGGRRKMNRWRQIAVLGVWAWGAFAGETPQEAARKAMEVSIGRQRQAVAAMQMSIEKQRAGLAMAPPEAGGVARGRIGRPSAILYAIVARGERGMRSITRN